MSLFDFTLQNSNGINKLYLQDVPVAQKLSILFSNPGADKYSFPTLTEGPPTAQSHHLALRFKKGVLANQNIELAGTSKGQWRISSKVGEEQTDTFYLKINVNEIDKVNGWFHDQSRKGIRIELDHIFLDNNQGTYQAQAQLLHCLDGPEGIERGGSRTLLGISSHQGQKGISIHLGFVGGNSVLNDGTSKNTLKLHITNHFNPSMLVPEAADINFLYHADHTKRSRLVFSFHSEGEGAPLKLTSEDKLRVIKFTPPEGWEIREPKQGKNIEWILWPREETRTLKVNQSLFIDIKEIITGEQTGFSKLYLRYEDIPGHWDGDMQCLIEKSPLLIKDQQVSIGSTTLKAELQVHGEISSQSLRVEKRLAVQQVEVMTDVRAEELFTETLSLGARAIAKNDVSTLEQLAAGNLNKGTLTINDASVNIGSLDSSADHRVYDNIKTTSNQNVNGRIYADSLEVAAWARANALESNYLTVGGQKVPEKGLDMLNLLALSQFDFDNYRSWTADQPVFLLLNKSALSEIRVHVEGDVIHGIQFVHGGYEVSWLGVPGNEYVKVEIEENDPITGLELGFTKERDDYWLRGVKIAFQKQAIRMVGNNNAPEDTQWLSCDLSERSLIAATGELQKHQGKGLLITSLQFYLVRHGYRNYEPTPVFKYLKPPSGAYCRKENDSYFLFSWNEVADVDASYEIEVRDIMGSPLRPQPYINQCSTTPAKIPTNIISDSKCWVCVRAVISSNGIQLKSDWSRALLSKERPVSRTARNLDPRRSVDIIFYIDPNNRLRGVQQPFNRDVKRYENKPGSPFVVDDVVDVAGNTDYMLFIKGNGELWGMGSNYYGQLGIYRKELWENKDYGQPADYKNDKFDEPVRICQQFNWSLGKKIVSVAAYSSTGYFIDEDGNLYVMGANIPRRALVDYDQFQPQYSQNKFPLQVDLLGCKAASVSAGGHPSSEKVLIATTDGRVLSIARHKSEFIEMPKDKKALAIASIWNNETAYILTEDGTLWGWGDNQRGKLGDTYEHEYGKGAYPLRLGGKTIKAVAITGGDYAGGFITSEGSLKYLGVNCRVGLRNTNTYHVNTEGKKVKEVTFMNGYKSSGYSLFVTQDGHLWAIPNMGDPVLVELPKRESLNVKVKTN